MNDMKITMPETRTVLFKDLEIGDFFIYDKELFRKTESVFWVDDVFNSIMNEQEVVDNTVFNAMLFDSYDGGGFQNFGDEEEVIPVSVVINVSYK